MKSGVQSLEFYITGAELQTERTQGAGFFYLHHALPEKRGSAQLPPPGEIWIIRDKKADEPGRKFADSHIVLENK